MPFRPYYVAKNLKGSRREGRRTPSRPKTIPPAKNTSSYGVLEITQNQISKEYKVTEISEYGRSIIFRSFSYMACWNYREGR